MVAAPGNLHRLPPDGDFRLFFRLLQSREQFLLFGILYRRYLTHCVIPGDRHLAVPETPQGEIYAFLTGRQNQSCPVPVCRN